MVTKQPISEGVMARALSGLKSAIGQKTQGWFSPLTPIAPVVPKEGPLADSVRGRAFDFQAGYNLRQRPRAEEAVSFEQMRALADSCDVLRLVIETRKDQMAAQKFTVRPIDEDKQPDDRCKLVEEFLRLPDGENGYALWQRMILEDMFVLDAVCIYPWKTNDGSLYSLDLIAPETIKRVINERGRMPLPPDPAYQQILKGVPAVDYTADELIYAVRNRRSNRVYGYSPVEQIIMTVNIAIRRALYQLQYYTEGSTPDMLFSVPEDWNMEQIKDFQDWWESKLEGNTGARRKGLFIPHGIAPVNTKEGALKDPYDEWLARIVCYAFSVSPSPFIQQINRATAESAAEQATVEGLHPIMQWQKTLLDTIIWKVFGFKDLHAVWDEQKNVDPQIQSEIDDISIKNGTRTINEVRESRGDDPVEGGDKPLVYLSTGPILLSKAVAQSAAQPDVPPPPPVPVAPPPGATPGKENAGVNNEKVTEPAVANQTSKLEKRAVKRIDRNRAAVSEARDKLCKRLTTQLKTVGAGVAKQVVAACDKVGKADSATLQEVEDEVQRVLDSLDLDGFGVISGDTEAILGDVLKDAGLQGLAQLGISEDKIVSLVNDKAVAWASEHAAELVTKVSESTRDMLRSTVTEAINQGWSNDTLASAIVENHAFSPERAMLIARTETADADVHGNLIAYKDSGAVAGKEWIVGDGCCDLCDAMDGTIVPIDDTFYYEGEEIDGPPSHPNCRCDVLPVLPEDMPDDTPDDTAGTIETSTFIHPALKAEQLAELRKLLIDGDLDGFLAKLAKVFDPNQPRDESGRWTAGMSGINITSQGTGGDRQWVYADGRSKGKPLSDEHLRQVKEAGISPTTAAAKLNPQYAKDVANSPYGGANLGAFQSVNDQLLNKWQVSQNEAHVLYAKDQKFARVREFDKISADSINTFRKDMYDPAFGDEPIAAYLMSQTGFRVGSGKDTGAEEKAYGVTEILASQVKVKGDSIRFAFPTKSGGYMDQTIKDSSLAEFFSQRLVGTPKNGEIFPTITSNDIMGYIRDATGLKSLQNKDMRTWQATTLARETIAKLAVPKTQAEFNALRVEVGKTVAVKLGHIKTKTSKNGTVTESPNYNMSLDNYIDPQVFAGWAKRITK